MGTASQEVFSAISLLLCALCVKNLLLLLSNNKHFKASKVLVYKDLQIVGEKPRHTSHIHELR